MQHQSAVSSSDVVHPSAVSGSEPAQHPHTSTPPLSHTHFAYLAGLALKNLALALFVWFEADLQAAAKVVRAAFKAKADRLRKEKKIAEANKYERLSNLHHTQLVEELPLSTWKRTVRRRYGPAERQSQQLGAWYTKYILDPTMFVAEGKTLIHGGEQGLEKFNRVWHSQLELVNDSMLSGEHRGS